MVPEKLRARLAAGEAELAAVRKAREEDIARERDRVDQDTSRRRLKRWGFLCVEATADLGYLTEYIDMSMPNDWDYEKGFHWFVMNIPGMTSVVAEYKRYSDEWRLTNWAVCHYEGSKKFWTVYPCLEKSIEYAFALAREAFVKKEKIIPVQKETYDPIASLKDKIKIVPCKKCGKSVNADFEYCEECSAQDESCGSWHQAVS